MKKAFRAEILHFLADPNQTPLADSYQHFADGILLVEEGRVKACAAAEDLLPQLAADVEVVDYRGHLLLPGFVDTHVHYPQIDIMACYGE